jgi:sugar lactone lactonase YvrE
MVVCLRGTPTLGHATVALQTLAVVGGQPDDITVDPRGRLVWGDILRGTVGRLDGHRATIIARGISVPEGIVTLLHGSTIVAEQGRDRIIRVDSGGAVTSLYQLRPVSGQEGVDGIARDTHTGDLLIPDSPNGTVLRMSLHGRHARVIARGLGRPVDAAIDMAGNVLVPDEHLGTLVVVGRRGHVSRRGTLSTPDDVSIDRTGRVWVTTLGDGGLWLMAPGKSPRRVLAGLANPQGMTLDTCGDPIVVEQNTARIVRVLLTRASAHCPI